MLNEAVDQFGNDRARQAQASLEVETRHAIENHDPELLEQKIESMSSLRFAILRSHPMYWVIGLDYMKENKSTMTDQAKANQLLQSGDEYKEKQDWDRLRITVHELAELLPKEQRSEQDYGYSSTVID